MKFAKFMSNPVGRGVRIVAGLALAIWGISMLAANVTGGVILIVVGAIVFLAGAMNWCLLAPLLGAPFNGRKLS